MNVVLRKPMSLDEFLRWEERQELRFDSTDSSQSRCLRGKPCRVIGSELRIAVAGNIRYPLAMPEIGVDLPLAELYEGVEFAAPAVED